MDLTTLSLDELIALADEKRTRFNEIKALKTPTRAEIAEAQTLAAEFQEIEQVKDALEGAEPATEEETAALAELSLDAPESEGDEEEDPDEEPEVEASAEETEEEGEPEVEAAVEPEPEAKPAKKVAAAVATKTRAKATVTLAGNRPVVPQTEKNMVTITAAADTNFATGSELDLGQVGQAVIHRLKGFSEPNGDGETEDLRMYPVANIAVEYPTEFQVNRGMDEEAIDGILQHAIDETRLEGNSLTAANGWCAPSETHYDLCGGEVVDGILSVPEVQVNRGGFKHTTGIDFATIFAGVGFLQTEAQAIAGTTKTCYEVPCPTFVDERLDAIGLCIKVPILLEVGYPEVVQRIMSGSMIAHQYKVNASVITRLLTIAGAALDPTPDFASLTGELLNTLDIQAEIIRQKYRLGATATLEVVLPVWAKSVVRNELGLRNGRPPEAVSDAEIMAHFTVRHFNVQFIYGWQELAGTELTWPATLEALIYPAGTIVKGVSNVINLSAVYDAASLASNIYTGLFFEQGLLLAKMCYEVRRVTIPVTAAFTGKTGAASL